MGNKSGKVTNFLQKIYDDFITLEQLYRYFDKLSADIMAEDPLEKKIKREAVNDNVLLSGEDYTEGEDVSEFKIVKKKKFTVKPMTPEEAVLQMNLLGHNFFVFKNAETEQMNVVYKRKDGNYAVIESV